MRIDRLALALLAALTSLAAGSARAATCPAGTNPIDETLTTGARWEICWAERNEEGVVLSDIFYTAPGEARAKVMKGASLAQIHLVYDDNRARRLIVSQDGLGGSHFVDLSAAECPDGTLVSDGAIDVLCKAKTGRGYAWKYYTQQQQGYWLELFSISRIGELTWIVRWRFYDSGVIEATLGASGRVTEIGSDPNFGSPGAGGIVRVGWVTSAYWRVDFDIGNAATDRVERFEVDDGGSTKNLTTTVLTTEGGELLNPQFKRSWRVRDNSTVNADGHKISYHLYPMQAGHHYVPTASETWTNSDLVVTTYKACERLASGNPTAGGCASDLAGFQNGESINGADVVLWYKTTYHYLPRDEDETFLGTRWQGFSAGPRDWTWENPLVLP